METLARVCRADDGVLLATPYKVVDVTDLASLQSGIQWWEQLTERGGEGMVIKPLEFVAKGRKGLVQPGVKCRGREYLRIIYGPEYTLPGNLERLTRPVCQALASTARVCAGNRRPGALRPPGTPPSRSRMRLRRPGPRKRTRGPKAVARFQLTKNLILGTRIPEFLPGLVQDQFQFVILTCRNELYGFAI